MCWGERGRGGVEGLQGQMLGSFTNSVGMLLSTQHNNSRRPDPSTYTSATASHGK